MDMLGLNPFAGHRHGAIRLGALLVLTGLLCAGLLMGAARQDPAPTAPDAPSGEADHGLRGSYYASGAFDVDPLDLPVPTGPAEAIRIDRQVAFGRDEGFVKGRGSQISWAPASMAGPMAVIWEGYIRFPQAGTYYLTTASRNGAAVHLNEARVALSVNGGYTPSETFAYADPGLEPSWDPARHTYLVPIEVEGPRLYPIEVRYVANNIGSVGFGIDLYWVTPGAQRDGSGKPLAELVPVEALYPQVPEALAHELIEAEASSAHTTLASDFLYYPAGVDSFATLTIRVADAQGRPLEGRRVHVSATVDRGDRDLVDQASAPTDRNGITTVRVRPPAGEKEFNEHTSRYIATVLGDYVHAAHEAEMRYSHGEGMSFLPYAFAPYYDGRSFLISPTPLQVGREATITVPLTNRQAEPYEVYISVTSKETNIGATDWNPLGRSERVVLQPGETRELSVGWTPEYEIGHVCFKTTVWGKPAGRRTASARASSPFLLVGFAPLSAAGQESDEARPMESRQQNVGTVAGCEPDRRTVEVCMMGCQKNVQQCYGEFADAFTPKIPTTFEELQGTAAEAHKVSVGIVAWAYIARCTAELASCRSKCPAYCITPPQGIPVPAPLPTPTPGAGTP